jgi:hypothetical protein
VKLSVDPGFLVVTASRSGTHMMRGLLNSHPDVTCDVEIFNGDVPAGKTGRPLKQVFEDMWSPGPLHGALAHMSIGWKGRPTPVMGERTVYPELFNEIPEGTKIIVLCRWNLLRRLVSQQLAYQKHGTWISTDPSQAVRISKNEKMRITVNPEQLRRDVTAQRMMQSTVGLRFVNAYRLTYEQLCADTPGQMRQVFEHIGADPEECPEPSTPTIKMAKFATLHFQVENYEALKEEFAGTDLEVYFDE